MISIRLKNYRCFEDTGKVEIKPINVLLGANSSGKSSFLKFFPLMKQSLRKHTNGLFLWYDDDVDFKDFKNAMRIGAEEMRIEVQFPLSWSIPGQGHDNETIFKAEIGLRSRDNNGDYLSFLKIEFAGHVIEISIGIDEWDKSSKVESVTINGADCSEKFKECILIQSDFLPTILYKDSHDSAQYSYIERPYLLRSKLLEFVGVHGNGGSLRANELTWKFTPYSGEELIHFVNTIREQEGESKLPDEQYVEFINTYLLFHLGNIMKAVDSYFIGQSEKVYYMQPLRAHAKRYYRYQNVAIDELDSHGDNLAMYLASLPPHWLFKLNEWLKENFKFELRLSNLEGHVQLEIRRCVTINGKERCTSTNLVDTGFGYSQMLPILVQVWHATERAGRFTYNRFRSMESKKLPLIIAIEQPELHLHPRLVAMFARMLGKVIGAAKSREIEVCFIIETHSKVLVETLGNIVTYPDVVKVKSGELLPEIAPNDIQVMIVNPEEDGKNNEILVTNFDEDGYLNEWPIGFFEGDVY